LQLLALEVALEDDRIEANRLVPVVRMEYPLRRASRRAGGHYENAARLPLPGSRNGEAEVESFQKSPLRCGAFSLQAYSTTPHVVGSSHGRLFVFVCGVGHRQDDRCRATLALGDLGRYAMSKSEQLLGDDLDCLRLASDLTQLASDALSPALKAYLLQLAQTCTGLVDRLETRH
jgi:hypothetical protein